MERRLESIDRELSGPGPLSFLLQRAPLLVPALALIVGILFQTEVDLSPGWWRTLALLLLPATFWILLRTQGQRRVTGLLAGCAVGFFVLGAVRQAAFSRVGPRDISRFVTQRQLATVRGSIVTPPRRHASDWVFAEMHPLPPPTTFDLDLTGVQTAGGWVQLTGILPVYVNDSATFLEVGDSVSIHCWLSPIRAVSNPGQFDQARRLARRNIFIGASVKSAQSIERLPKIPGHRLTATIARWRQRALSALTEHIPADNTAVGLIQALILGARQDVTNEVHGAFEETGLLHLLSLSGMHIGILFGLVWWLSQWSGFLKPGRAMVCALAIALFVLMVPGRPPTLRAATLCWTLCLAMGLRRFPHPINALSLAAILMLLVRPTQMVEAGWQLSFTCVLGILVITPRLQARLSRTLDRMRGPPVVLWCLRRVTSLLAVGIGAWLGGLGVLVFHFHSMTLWSALWTLLALPFVTLILALGFLKLVLALLIPVSGWLLGPCLYGVAKLLIALVSLLAEIPPGVLTLGNTPLGLILGYYGLLLAATFLRPRQRPVMKHAFCWAGAACLVAGATLFRNERAAPASLVLTCLDVGHGLAQVAQIPGYGTLIIDTGSLYQSNVGQRIVKPFLRYRGIGRLRAIILSHSDSDHINGVPELVDRNSVGILWANRHLLEQTSDWGPAQTLSNFLEGQGRSLQLLPPRIDAGPARIDILWPPAELPGEIEASDNNRSLVARIEFAGRSIMISSDIEGAAQRALLDRYPKLRADVVISPHHGSKKTLDPGFLARLQPQIVITSCARAQYDQQRVMDPVPNAYYTARDGAITVIIKPDGEIEVSTWVGKQVASE